MTTDEHTLLSKKLNDDPGDIYSTVSSVFETRGQYEPIPVQQPKGRKEVMNGSGRNEDALVLSSGKVFAFWTILQSEWGRRCQTEPSIMLLMGS